MSTKREPSEYFDEGETVLPQTLVDKRWQAIDILVEHASGQLPFY